MRRTLAPLATITEEVDEKKKKKKQKHKPTSENVIENNTPVEDAQNVINDDALLRRRKKSRRRHAEEATKDEELDIKQQKSPIYEIDTHNEPESTEIKKEHVEDIIAPKFSEEPEIKPKKRSRRKREEDQEQHASDVASPSSYGDTPNTDDTLQKNDSFRPHHSIQKKSMVEKYSNVVDELRGAKKSSTEVDENIFDTKPTIDEPEQEEPEQKNNYERVKTPIISSMYGSVYQKQRQREEEMRRSLTEQELKDQKAIMEEEDVDLFAME